MRAVGVTTKGRDLFRVVGVTGKGRDLLRAVGVTAKGRGLLRVVGVNAHDGFQVGKQVALALGVCFGILALSVVITNFIKNRFYKDVVVFRKD